MDWVKKNLELALLFGVLILLLGVALFKTFTFSPYLSTESSLSESNSGQPKIKQDLDQYADLAKRLEKGQEWKASENGHRLFISRKLEWLANQNKLKLYRPDEAGVDGIAPAWKEQYGFSLSDPTVADQDPDMDGFTNKEEYLGKTDPLNAESRPPYTSKLRLVKFEAKPYSFQFTGINQVGGEVFFQVKLSNPRDKKNRSNSLRKGEEFEGWVVQDYREKKGERENPKMHGVMLPYDESELEIYNPVTDKKLILIMKQKLDAPILTGTLMDLIDQKTYTVEEGHEFLYRDKKYRVKKMSETGAVLSELNQEGKEEKEIEITVNKS